MDAKKVFISYSHDSDAHSRRVLALADTLRRDGIDSRIDQYFPAGPPEGWMTWTENTIESADFVLMVCTEIYHRRVRKQEKEGSGLGVTWEAALIYQLLYQGQGRNAKFLPVIFEESDQAFIPTVLRSHSHFLLDSQEGYDRLYALITGQLQKPAELGDIRLLQSETTRPLFGPAGGIRGRSQPERSLNGFARQLNRLIIRHADENRFMLIGEQGPLAATVELTSPVGFPVAGYPDSDLMAHLRWYLEDFLKRPFHPDSERAVLVQQTLQQWGTEAFDALFASGKGRDAYRDAKKPGLDHLHLQISSDDSRVLGWPWEALFDSEAGYLAHGCQIDRRLVEVQEQVELAQELPRDRINILLITARPFEGDIAYRTVSRPLVELIEKKRLPALVRVLRPPTFERLREHLREKRNFYHIVHFDGHGEYRPTPSNTGVSEEHLGRLIFEQAGGGPDPKNSRVISALMREFRIPVVVLNACRSGMLDEQAEDAFASIATSLVRAGVRGVVAMAYSLYVSGAQEFLPAFYNRLFETGSLGAAVREGRQKMLADPGRVCARGRFDLQDWLVPVLYQQEAFDFSFAQQAKPLEKESRMLPSEAADQENPYGFIGRDGPILTIERALRRDPAAILIHGLGGVGKTTLARGFLRWLAATDGLGEGGVFWFSFLDFSNVEFLVNRMVEPIFGTAALAESLAEKLEALGDKFQEHRFLIVWDNFEIVDGAGEILPARFSAEDRRLLKEFLKRLRSGRSKVIITSRSPEEWLGKTNRFKVDLAGLQGEERWEFCNRILADLAIQPAREDRSMIDLMDALDGHPLSMRVMLAEMDERTPAQLLEIVRGNLGFFRDDPANQQLFATLRFVEESLPAELQELLFPLSLHVRIVDGSLLAEMARHLSAAPNRTQIDRFLGALAGAGLLRDRGHQLYEIHPALGGYLAASERVTDQRHQKQWSHHFCQLYAGMANYYAPQELHQQRRVFALHSGNFEAARSLAARLQATGIESALVQALASYAYNTANLDAASVLYHRLARLSKNRDPQAEAVAFHQIGLIAAERRRFGEAEKWYLQSLDIRATQGDELGAAATYHQLGMIAEEQRLFAEAENWYRQAIEIRERLGEERWIATDYHQLGIVAIEQRQFEQAEAWFRKSMEIFEAHGAESGVASSYHQLGIIAQEEQRYDDADRFFRQALEIFERLGDPQRAAITYTHLGVNARHLGRFPESEQWHRKALEIYESLGNQHHAAITYHALGMTARDQGHQEEGEKWFRKAIEIFERQGETHQAARPCAELGLMARSRGEEIEAVRWLLKALQAFSGYSPRDADLATREILVTHHDATPEERSQIEHLWSEAGCGDFPRYEIEGDVLRIFSTGD